MIIVSILHKCDYNAIVLLFFGVSTSVSILHKCDYNANAVRSHDHLNGFQFYISAIITRLTLLVRFCYTSFQFYISAIITRVFKWMDKIIELVSILHKCDYNVDVAKSQSMLQLSFNST